MKLTEKPFGMTGPLSAYIKIGDDVVNADLYDVSMYGSKSMVLMYIDESTGSGVSPELLPEDVELWWSKNKP